MKISTIASQRKSWLATIWIVIILCLLGSVAGTIVGYILFTDFVPPWRHLPIQSPPEGTSEILLIDSSLGLEEDPTNNIVYIKTESGAVYFISLFQTEWQLIEPLPNGDEIMQLRFAAYSVDYSPLAMTKKGNVFQWVVSHWIEYEGTVSEYVPVQCATEWAQRPPIKKGILDSAGFDAERPLSSKVQCYTLYADGSLEVWMRSTDMSGLMAVEMMGIVSGQIIGGIFGFIIMYAVRRNLLKFKTT